MANFSGAASGLFANNLAFHPVDLFILGTFLVATLAVGASYGGRAKTMHDYALGGKNFSTLALTATIIATWFGGGTFYYLLPKLYTEGLFFIISSLGAPIGLLIIGQLQAMRMGRFMNNVSTAEAMGDMYGKTIQVLSAISGAVVQVGYVAMQFQVISKVLALAFGTQDERLSITAALIVILYSAWGGVRSVTFTDVVQFFTFGALIPILALVIWSNLRNPLQVAEVLTQNPKFHLTEVVGWNSQFIGALSLMLYFTTHGANPSMFQRVSMARNLEQARKAYTYAAFITLAIYLIMAWVAVLLLADNPNIEPDKLVNYLINRYTYPGFKGLIAAGIVALAMSTADSCINSCAVLFTNDLAAPLGFRKVNPVLAARLSSVVIGLLGLSLAMYESDLLTLLLLTGSFYMPIVGVPLWLAIFGFQTTKRVVLISMATGFTTVLLWRNFLGHTGIDSVMPATLTSLFILLGAHYLLGESGGWQEIDADSLLGRERAARKAARYKRLQVLRTFNLYSYLRQCLPSHEGTYSLVGFYATAATYIGFYTIERSDAGAYKDFYEVIYHTIPFITTTLITYPIWPFKSQRFITFFWPLGIVASLFFVGMLLVIMSHFHPLQVMVLMINLLVVALVLPVPLSIILAIVGVSLAAWFFGQYAGAELPWSDLGSLQLRMAYSLLLFTSLLIALFKYQELFKRLGSKYAVLQNREKDQQERLLQAAAEKQAVLRALKHTGADKLLSMISSLQTLHVAKEDKEHLEALQTSLIPIAFQLQGLDTRAQEYLRLKIQKLQLNPWCEEVKKALEEKGVPPGSLHCRLDTPLQELNVDGAQLTRLLVSSIVALHSKIEAAGLEEKPTISVRLHDTQLAYPLPDVREGYIKYIPAVRIAITAADDLPELQKSYSPNLAGPNPVDPQTPAERARLDSTRIIKSHYGYTEFTDDTLVYVIPVDVEDVRPQDMDKDFMEVGAELKRSDDQFVDNGRGIDAQAQEKAFLAAVAKRSKADLGMVRMALELIKWYHSPRTRHSGEPFYLHPLAVAHIVLDYNQAEATIIGALLHDTVEDTPMQLEHIEAMFGKETAEVVDLVTHLQSIPGSIYKIKLSAVENLQMLERAEKKIGLYVKLADRMHNMRTIKGHKSIAKQKLIATETLQFFVPLAKRLGLTEAAQEFEHMCLEVLETQE